MDNRMAGMVLVGLVIIVLLIVGRELLKDRDKTGLSWNVSAYLNIFKTGWRAARKNLWIFWILWTFSIVAMLQNFFLRLSVKGFQFTPFSRLFHGFHTFSLSFEELMLNLLRAPDFIPFSFGLDNSILLLFALVFLIPPFKKVLLQTFTETRTQTSVNLLRKNLLFFVILTIMAVALRILWSISPGFQPVEQSRIFVPIYFYSLIMVFWSAFVQALLTGFIFSLFRVGVLHEEADRNSVFISSLKFFRPLFFFFLILLGVFHCSVILISFFHSSSYIPFIIHWLSLFFLFVPYFMVQMDFSLRAALRLNISSWKQNWRQDLAFFLAVVLMVSVVNYLLSFLWRFTGTYYYLIVQVAERTVRLIMEFWIAALIMAFCMQLTGRTKGVTNTSPDPAFGESLLETTAQIRSGKMKWYKHEDVF